MRTEKCNENLQFNINTTSYTRILMVGLLVANKFIDEIAEFNEIEKILFKTYLYV